VLGGSLSRLDVPESSILTSISFAMTNVPDIELLPCSAL
jgi:hypothetical protein